MCTRNTHHGHLLLQLCIFRGCVLFFLLIIIIIIIGLRFIGFTVYSIYFGGIKIIIIIDIMREKRAKGKQIESNRIQIYSKCGTMALFKHLFQPRQ